MPDTVATLWIGSKLSFLERLSLKSFHDVGQTPILYLYDKVEDPPPYVEIRDAQEVMHEAFVQQHWGKDRLDDPRIHSDIFRVMLMRKTDHIWVDADVYALHPHQTTDGYLFAARKKRFIPNGVVRVPHSSPALRKMEEFVSATGNIPPWWSDAQVAMYNAEHSEVSFETLPVGVTGPEAFGHFIYETGEHRYGKKFSYLYPVAARHSVTLLDSPNPYNLQELRAQSMSLHLYATGIRRRLTKRGGGVPPIGSLLYALCKTHNIDPTAYPITHRDAKASVRNFRQQNRTLQKNS